MNYFKKIFYNIYRNYLKKEFTKNLGTVVEEEDKLICYVKQKNLNKERYSYTIPCVGINKNNQKLANKFNLNKPICYIIDGINTETRKVYIFGYNNAEVIIRNCKFNFGASINVNKKCTLENTHIRIFHLLTIRANDLIIKNMNINHEMSLINKNLQISISAEKLSIINSNIGEKINSVKAHIESDEINMINSKIMGNEITVKSKLAEIDNNSSLTALKNANIKIDTFNKLNILSQVITLNGKDISNYGKNIELVKENIPLITERIKLLKTLKNIRNKCNKINEELTKNFKDLQDNQSVNKILKK